MAINRNEFASLEPEFFIYPITWHRKTGKLSRFGVGEPEFEDVLTNGFIVFSPKDIQTRRHGDVVRSAGYILYFNTHLEEIGLTPNETDDFFTYQGERFEVLSVTKVGPADNNTFVLTKVEFKESDT